MTHAAHTPIEWDVYNPDAPKSWWPENITGKRWAYEALVNKCEAVVINAPSIEAAQAFLDRYGFKAKAEAF